ncbi:MAG TPA: rRNA maturation RNase YbeY [Gemmatimonadaceae bacterium]|nr:rRNA maturation RNase YbeY [Gemmatimonadaceae bacterium]
MRRPRVDVGRDGVRRGLAPARVRAIVRTVLRAEGARASAVSVTFVSDAVMRRLNARFLGRRRPTDVIAFGMDAGDGSRVGDVYVSPDAARRSAAAERVPVREELVRLVVHGTLHVIGHDHPEGPSRVRSAMWRRQEALVRRVRAGAGR